MGGSKVRFFSLNDMLEFYLQYAWLETFYGIEKSQSVVEMSQSWGTFAKSEENIGKYREKSWKIFIFKTQKIE